MCGIYATKPAWCAVDRDFWSPEKRAEMFALTAENCNKMQVELGIDESFRVILE